MGGTHLNKLGIALRYYHFPISEPGSEIGRKKHCMESTVFFLISKEEKIHNGINGWKGEINDVNNEKRFGK